MRTEPQPAGFADVRVTNLAVVLTHVRTAAPCSRADIATATGLNKGTVSSLVAELIERHMLREIGLVERRIGRPATMIEIDGSRHAAIGLEVSADHLSIEGVNLAGDRVLSWRRTFPGLTVEPSRAVASIVTLLRKAIVRIGADGRQVLGVTVGVPGLVNGDGLVTSAPNLRWRDIDLRKALMQGLHAPSYPVVVDNDARLSALAEYRFGAHAGTPNLVVVSGEVGVGAGIIADGHMLRGSLGYAGEIGHLPVDRDGPECPCGQRGCLEVMAGIPALIGLLDPDPSAGAEADPDPDPGAGAGAGQDGPVRDFEPEVRRIADQAAAGEPAVLAGLEVAGRHLGYAIAVLVSLLNPAVVILGGYYVPLGRWLLPAAEAELQARTAAPHTGGCQIAISTLGHGAAALGGIARTLDAVHSGELL